MTFSEILRDDLFEAYYNARKNKRNTQAQLQFELELEKNLIDLRDELLNRSYTPNPLICFISTYPVKREIFASEFRDRIVHHLIFSYIEDIFERTFIYDSYSCRKAKGTLFGIQRLDHHIRSCSNNYTKETFVLKLDIKGYFMSINKNILYSIISRKLNKYWTKHKSNENIPSKNIQFVDYLIRTILFKDPTKDCIIRGSKELWKDLPQSKSLFGHSVDVGLPIGDLTSQLFSNIYMNELDNYIKRELKVAHYGRYVDDFYLVHNSKEYLIKLIPIIRYYLQNELSLAIHPQKIYLQNVLKGVHFLGIFIKAHRKYIVPRTKKQFIAKMSEIDLICRKERLSKEILINIRSVLNSYLGYFYRYKTQQLIHKHIPQNSLCHYFSFKYSMKKALLFNSIRFFNFIL